MLALSVAVAGRGRLMLLMAQAHGRARPASMPPDVAGCTATAAWDKYFKIQLKTP